jgi:GxxExxY protein
MENQMPELLLKDEVYAIVGAAIEVYNEMGSGFLEAVYQETMELELKARGIPFEPQKELCIYYKSTCLNKKYIADLVCFGSVLVELKVMREIGSGEEAQLLNYLNATGLRVGIIINFGDPGRLDWKRMVR